MQVICWSHEVSQSILTLTPQNSHHNQNSIYTFDTLSHVFHVEPWQGDIPHKARERGHVGPEKELICLASVIT